MKRFYSISTGYSRVWLFLQKAICKPGFVENWNLRFSGGYLSCGGTILSFRFQWDILGRSLSDTKVSLSFIHCPLHQQWYPCLYKTALHLFTKQPYISAKEPNICTKQHYISTKQPYISAKEPYISTKGPYISTKQPYISAKEPYILTKELYISAKEA